MAWRVAHSLDQLLAQLNALAPTRSRASDGSIGDAAHQAEGSASDHNPWFVLGGQALVTARDITHDPGAGLDCHKLAAALIAAKDPRVKYLIWQGRLMDSRAVRGNNYRPWTWQAASGHYQHLHLSVMDNASADDTRPWSLPGLTNEEDDVSLSQDDIYRMLTARVISQVDPVTEAPTDKLPLGDMAWALKYGKHFAEKGVWVGLRNEALLTEVLAHLRGDHVTNEGIAAALLPGLLGNLTSVVGTVVAAQLEEWDGIELSDEAREQFATDVVRKAGGLLAGVATGVTTG